MRHLLILRMIEDVHRAGSIRKAAEDMNLTSSALNRRIQAFEREFGAPIFERLARGVRLNPAGELLLQHIRAQVSDLARVRSQVADLGGERRGHVVIACSQALAPRFMPGEIAGYRAEHPGVTFEVKVRDRQAAEAELRAFAADLALVFEPVYLADFEVIFSIPQPICAVMRRDHPLAARRDLRLRDCLSVPHSLPSAPYGVRHLLDLAVRGRSLGLRPVVESDSFEFLRRHALAEGVVTFQIPIGLGEPPGPDYAVRPLSAQDAAPGHLLLGQLRGRALPVAAARFGMRIQASLRTLAAPFA